MTPAATKTTGTRRARTTAAQQVESAKKLSMPEAIVQVLSDGRPMKCKQIIAEVLPIGDWKGRSPVASISACLYLAAKKPDGIVLKTKEPGTFKLNPKRKVKETVAA